MQVEYPQDWLTEDLAATGQKQAAWRTDPKQSGAGGAIGDIGTHAYNLARFVTGLELDSLSADLDAFVPGRQLDDNVNVMLRFKGGAPGHALGEPGGAGQRERAEAARLRHQGRARMGAGRPELSLVHAVRQAEAADHPRRRRRRAGRGARHAACRRAIRRAISKASPTSTRKPRGPSARRGRRAASRPRTSSFPTVQDGVEGVAFVEACVRSSKKNAAWTRL